MEKRYHIYTDEEDAWLLENYRKYMYTELQERFQERFDTEISLSSLKNHCISTLRLFKGLGKRDFSQDQEDWIRENYNAAHPQEMVKAFNDQFGTNYHQNTMLPYIYNVMGIKRNTDPEFTPEEEEWLRNHFAPQKKEKGVEHQFYETFGRRVPKNVLRYHALKLVGAGEDCSLDFTSEQEGWLERHAKGKSPRQLGDSFNKKFDMDIPFATVYTHALAQGYCLEGEREQKAPHFYTPEENAWIIEHVNTCSQGELTILFNETFGTEISRMAMTLRVQHLGLSKKQEKHVFTSQEDAWIRQNMKRGSIKSQVGAFNERFGTEVSYSYLLRHVNEKGMMRTGQKKTRLVSETAF